jgi:hypothetical protein
MDYNINFNFDVGIILIVVFALIVAIVLKKEGVFKMFKEKYLF